MKARRAVINGYVQGVGFRFFARRAALEEGVVGWVRNCPDGTVETVVEGELVAVERYLEKLRQGPGRVTSVDVREETPTGHQTFEITR